MLINVPAQNAFDCSGQTAFHLACANGYSSIVRALLGSPRVDVRARTDKGLTGFALACQEGNLEVLEILMDDPRIPRYTAGKGGVTPLMLAVLRKQTAVVHLLLKDNEINSNAADENGVTALHLAAELGDPEILAMFLAQPDRVDFSVIMTRNAKTPLDVAHPSVKAMLQTAVDAQRTYTWENFPIRPKA